MHTWHTDHVLEEQTESLTCELKKLVN